MSDGSAKLEAFRKEVRTWLRENLPKGWGTPEYKDPERFSTEAHELGKLWQKKLYDAGYAGFGYPKEYGGVERPPEEIAVIREELLRHGSPFGPLSLGLLMAAPTIMAHGEEWQKERFIPKILSGEESWCELFSEPNAGSDVANIQTTAVKEGDEWVVNGQKIWTSMWEFSDWGILAARSDPNAPRHHNLTCFIVDCKSPGYTKLPLKQMTGTSEFGEEYFDNVRIPDKNRLGEVNKGWGVILAGLMAERSGGGAFWGGMGGGRSATGGAARGIGMLSVKAIIDLAKETHHYGRAVWDDPVFRQKIANLAIEVEAMRYSGLRMVAKMRKGIMPTNEASIVKNFQAEMRRRQGDMVMEIIGAYSQLMRDSKRAIDGGEWVYQMMRARGATIEMGTSEINRNIIAERVLGLPR
ncbi:MAG: acyl-CoA dehydrogenase family protein [Chloroflexota bacterium]|nr:MAG: acyl-CoA dehydrogenase family protein [Chloroflexota bacterium]